METNKKGVVGLIIIGVILVVGSSWYAAKNNAGIEKLTYQKGSAEEVAQTYVKEHSVEGLEFVLSKDFDDGKFAEFHVTPTGKSAEGVDEARIILRKTNTGYEVIGFGTAFPDLEEHFPELKGRI